MVGYKDYLERMNTHTYEIVDGKLPLLSVGISADH